MSAVEVHPFRRGDREQITDLVNAHVAAVVPGISVPVNAVLSQLEREPGEFIVDPWVIERATLVAEQRDRIVAAAHLLRYGDDDRVGEDYRNVGEIRWLLCWLPASFWPDAQQAGDALVAACVGLFERWRVGRAYADGTLPAPGVYGVPEQWPHVRAIYERAGFRHAGQTEIVFVADVAQLPAAGPPPLPETIVRRSVGINGTRFSALVGEDVLGYVEVDTTLAQGGRLGGVTRWADIGNLHVADQHRRKVVATWLVGQAAEWLRLARFERLLDYARPEALDYIAFLEQVGFRELTRTARGWIREA